MPFSVKAYGATSPTSELTPMNIQRRDVGANDIKIVIDWCGICHSDLHVAHADWDPEQVYPVVPGHEFIGHVSEVGPSVTKYKVGDKVAIGCILDSCRECEYCKSGDEQACVKGFTWSFNGPDPDFDGLTKGGNSESIVVNERYALSIPDNLYKPEAAPLLCAGITTWVPLAEANIEPGQKVGVVGLGGLGHMGIKFAKALGAEAWAITTSAKKEAGAKKLGADGLLVSTNEAQMKKHEGTFDFILNTIPVKHDLSPYIALQKYGTTQCIVGAPDVFDVPVFQLIPGKKSVKGSALGGLRDTAEMLDFCSNHNVLSSSEVVGYDKINEAWDRLAKNDIEYRFVLDNSTL